LAGVKKRVKQLELAGIAAVLARPGFLAGVVIRGQA
jgi:hypothetical protein